MKTGLNNMVKKTRIKFNDFIHIWLDTIILWMVRSEEMAVLAGKDTLKQ